jgi:LmbE family N-acetylglucosaminyl deacetylase
MEEFKSVRPDAEQYIQSGYDRQKESINALKILGLNEKNIIFLGYPDGGINSLFGKNWETKYLSPYTKTDSSPYNTSFQKEAPYTGQNLENNILEILKKYQPTYVIMPNIKDINRDHSASGKFIEKALIQYSKDGFQKPVAYSYLIHFRAFPKPKGRHPDRLLTPPNKLIEISDGWVKISLDEKTENLKIKAINEYISQLKSPTLKEVMESFIRKNELLSETNFGNF